MTDEEYNPDIESRQDYYDRIEMSADIIEDRLDDDPDLEPSEMVFEEVDGSRAVIYTHEALSVLRYADEQPEEWKHFVDDSDTWQSVIQALAFSIYRQSLYKELRERDVV